MPSWEDIRSHLRARYVLVSDQDTWVGMEWTFTHAGAVIKQRVKVERFMAFGSDWALILAAVCNADRIHALSALRFNARLPIGSLAVERDKCYLRAALALDTLSYRDLDRAIELVARETARLRDPRPRGDKSTPFVSHYEE
jgi:hypothetical protein